MFFGGRVFLYHAAGLPTMLKQYLGSVIVGALILLCLSGFGRGEIDL